MTQQSDIGKLMQRVVDGRERHRNLGMRRFFVEHFRREMPVALAEQDPAERHALARGTQTDLPQQRLHVMPGAAVETCRSGRRKLGLFRNDRRRETHCPQLGHGSYQFEETQTRLNHCD